MAAHESFLSEALDKAINLVELAQTELARGRDYSKSRQECLEGIFDDFEAAEAAQYDDWLSRRAILMLKNY